MKTAEITGWNNYVFLGTSVVSGTATAVVVKTGGLTEYGKIAKQLVQESLKQSLRGGLEDSDFNDGSHPFPRGVCLFHKRIFLSHARVLLQSLLFAVALAVGLTPELLPMIMSINLSRGAVAMSKKGVIVKRLSSIQNFGNMDVLCTDKTGTLTENKMTLVLHVDMEGKDDEKVLLYSFLNSYFETGLKSPLDEAILSIKRY